MGYAATKKEFENCIRKITQLGYGLVVIAHVEKRVEKRADDTEVEILGPAIPKRAYEIINQLVDIIGYIDVVWNEDGSTSRYLYTRKTPTVMAGSRFRYLAPKIDFGYKELVDAIADAIDKEQSNGATVVDTVEQKVAEKLNYKELMDEAKQLWTKLVHPEQDGDEDMARTILKKIEMVFGHPMKLSEITEDQVDLLQLVVLDMKDLTK